MGGREPPQLRRRLRASGRAHHDAGINMTAEQVQAYRRHRRGGLADRQQGHTSPGHASKSPGGGAPQQHGRADGPKRSSEHRIEIDVEL
jgi:hypothetical protein